MFAALYTIHCSLTRYPGEHIIVEVWVQYWYGQFSGEIVIHNSITATIMPVYFVPIICQVRNKVSFILSFNNVLAW